MYNWRSLIKIGFLFTQLGWAVAGQDPGRQQWIYASRNLAVDKNLDELEALLRRAAKVGYTHVLLADSKFARLGDMDAHYFRNVSRVKGIASELNLELVPALFPIGYS